MNFTKSTRKQFIKTGFLAAAGVLFPKLNSLAQQPDVPPPLKPEAVKEFVRVCHSNLGRVKEMLENDHLLLHCAWDLGGGDFESGIEAAGHVGNKEITDYLLGKGARYNIFLAAMYGNLDVIRNVLTAQPQLLNAKGPHGLTLLHHANKGGVNAKPVADYLTSLGATETKINFYSKR